MSLCVIFVSIDKLNNQKTPFSSIIQLFFKKKKNAFYCKSHIIKKKKEKKKKIAIDKMLWSKTFTSRLCKNGSIHIHYGKGKEAHLRIFFISIVKKSSECISKYNIYTTFKEVVILLARTICSYRTDRCCSWKQPTPLESRGTFHVLSDFSNHNAILYHQIGILRIISIV